MQILSNQKVFNNTSIIKKKNIVKEQINLEEKYSTQINSVYYPIFTALKPKVTPTKLERFEGCLLGGAIGDAFGAVLEKMSIPEIKAKFGGDLKYLITQKDGIAEFTDDTQMTLFTIEGLLSAIKKYSEDDIEFYKTILKSYKNWYTTQTSNFQTKKNQGGLMGFEDLYKRKEPGITCLNALKSDKVGSIKNRINNSAGNGGVMRIAPVGLLYCNNTERAFDVGNNIAALTHGHPNGFLPAGCLAHIIALLVKENSLEQSIEKTKIILKKQNESLNLLKKIEQAQELAKSSLPIKEAIEQLGAGWTGDEALAIALYANLKHPEDYKSIIRTAANHGGDSDTTATIAGNIAGTICGKNNIPSKWLKSIEMRTLLEKYSLFFNYLTNENGLMGKYN